MRHQALCLLLPLVACAGGGVSGFTDQGGTTRPDVSIDRTFVSDFGTEARPEASIVFPDQGTVDVEGPEQGPGVPPECETNADCESGLCVEAPDGKKYCAVSCLDQPCPPGWKCTQVTGTGADTLFVCLPEQTFLCRPCISAADCMPAGVKTKDLCVEFGPVGRFCGKDCSASECPEGYECVEIAIRGAGTYKQCLPITRVCECTEEFAAGGYETVCYIENGFGKCEGKTKCTAYGLAPCTAKTPAPEECNGEDDNCDGSVDNGLKARECEKTFGEFVCKGPEVCEGGQWVCKAQAPTMEKCDGLDNDCDGETDEEGAEGCVKYYLDEDNDGYGVGEFFRCLCGPSGSYQALAVGDCDDSNAKVNPGALEKCNTLDDDCDGLIDEEGAAGCMDFYKDLDQDGFGGAFDVKCLCGPEGEYVVQVGGDCNDANPLVFPGAPEECNGLDDDCNGVTDDQGAIGCVTYYKDADGDGFGVATDFKCLCGPTGAYAALAPGDCDDLSKGINPGAQEACNKSDDDCDGETDEEDALGCIIYYEDVDGDGFGAPGAPGHCLCLPNPPFQGTSLGDCDDASASVYPGATEKCNGIDDNCDGETDEPGAQGCTLFYWDADGDGYGVTEDSKCLCAAKDKYTAQISGDCADLDPAVNPGAQESCGNLKDDDCNGATDEEGALGCENFYRDMDGDGFGVATDFKCLCAPASPYTATVPGDCDDKDPKVSTGQAEACDGKDNDCDGLTDEEGALGCSTYFKDADSDGFGVTGDSKCLCAASAPYVVNQAGDCDDSDPTIYPGAAERCNNRDDDCDGQTDEEGALGCEIYFKNADGDGFGVSGDTKCLCGPLGQYNVKQGGDCDDLDPGVYPGATEKCNGKDDDCDGTTDEEGAQGCKTFYYDDDGDGWGQDGNTRCLCYPFGKYNATKGQDCNDNDATINPGQPEKCGNSKDDDCDGLTDEEGGQGCVVYYKDADNDGYGLTNDSKCLCSPFGFYRATSGGDCNDSDANVYPGASEKCNGYDDDCDAQTDEEGAVGCITYYYDNDGDTYGVSGNWKCLCSPSGKYTATRGGDCNDNNSNIYPGAQEVCNNLDDDCDGTTDQGQNLPGCTTYYFDNDGDSWGVFQSQCLCKPSGKYSATKTLDCDDNNAQVNPGATEKCNSVDDDCDGFTDEEGAQGCMTYYYDNDGDTYGVSNNSKCLCSPSGKYSATRGGDCNDDNASIYPGAQEKCNGQDDDCDGQTDEEGAQGCTTFYYDNDGDGYGVSNNSKCLCAPSGKYTAPIGGDCNDNNSSVYPGATERCNGIDDNCDGITDQGENLPGCTNYYYDNDGDTWGTSSYKCLCAPSGKYTATRSGDCNDSDSSIYPGATEICDVKDNDCDGLTDEGFDGFPDSWPGFSIGEYPAASSGTVYERLTPPGEQDWMWVWAVEQSIWCAGIKCKVELKDIPAGRDYDLCACWSSETGFCDLAALSCSTNAGNANEVVQVELPEYGCVWPGGNGATEKGYCDIVVVGYSGASCSFYTLTWQVWE